MNPSNPASDAEAVAAWEATLAQGRFRIQQCRDCGSFGFPPAARCQYCSAEALRWVEPSGRAVVHATAVALPAGQLAGPVASNAVGSAGAEAAVPALVMIELEEGPRLPGRVMDVELAELKPGLAVSAHVGLLGGKPAVLFYSKEQGSSEW